MLKKLRQKIHLSLLKKRIGKTHRSHKTKSLAEAKHISILFDASQKQDSTLILNWAAQLKAEGKEVSLLAYISHKLEDYKPNYPYFTKKDVNWLYFTNNEQVEWFINKRSDILCCLFIEENLTLESIAALSNAQFRVGKFHQNKTYCFDFMIDLKKDATTKVFLEQTNHFLNQIKSTNASAV